MITLNLLALAIGVGLLLTLLVTEAFGIAAGGLVVPGYMALKLMQPVNFTLTILVALAAFAVIRVLSSFTVIYGRRMTALTILTAYLLGALLELLIGGGVAFDMMPGDAAMEGGDAGTDALSQQITDPVFVELGVIGYIIPGLIALWFNRQGVMQTLCGADYYLGAGAGSTLIVLIPDLMIAYDSTQISFLQFLEEVLGSSAGR